LKRTYQNICSKQDFITPEGWLKIKTIDMHTGGEPLRVIVNGLPKLEGNSVLEYRRYMKENLDHIRTSLMFEPRGHADMYGCVLLPPNQSDADFGILFLHNEGYSTMCGHAIIAITKLAVEMGWVEKKTPETKLEIDAPCGRITSFAKIANGKVESVYFYCVPSFVVALEQQIQVSELGMVTYDLAYGGAFYAYVDADRLGLQLLEDNYSSIIKKGMDIKHAIIKASDQVKHPFEEDLSFLYGTIFISKEALNGADNRNVCVFAEGEVDRSPTGSGVAGRMAIHHKRQELAEGEEMIIESILGTKFKGSVHQVLKYGPYDAIIPRVEGNAFIIGQNEWLIDPNDPLKNGFILR